MEVEMVPAAPANTASRTLADMVGLASQRYGDAPALRHKTDGRWVDVSYRRLAETAREVGLGLADLGVDSGDRVAILSHTRPEWTYANLGILASGAASVAIYQTNSAEECHYVLEHSESRAVFVEDAEQLAKVRAVEARLPHLEWVIVMAPDGDVGDVTTLEQLRERGRGLDAAGFDERVGEVSPEDPALFIYTSGTTGPPKGCVLTHANYRSVCTMIESRGMVEPGDVAYLFLPLAHAFAVLIQFAALDVGGTIAYWERDPKKIVPNLSEVRPTTFPSVPRIFEKIHTAATSKIAEQGALKQKLFWWAVGVGRRVREREHGGGRPGPVLRLQHALADRLILSKAKAAFGGNLRHAVTGAAPIATEILEFFWACGVPVLEGYGMTETSTVAACNTLEAYRLGSVGRPLPGVEVRIAEDGEIILKGANIFGGYYRNEEATAEALVDGWLHTGDLGHLDDDGFLYVTGRKKDIIITAGGKNVTPANLENSLKQSRWISQAVVLGDRRPYLVALVALDPEEAPAFTAEHGLAVEELPGSAEMRAEIQRAIDAVNARVGPVEQIKRFRILPRDLTLEAGELTPSLKVKRAVVAERYATEVEELYSS